MKDVTKALAGVAVAGVVSFVWEIYPQKNIYRLVSSPLAFIEHYHWGLASILVGHRFYKKQAPILYGFGAGLIAVEAASSQPFGFGKPAEQFVPGLALGTALTLLIFLT